MEENGETRSLALTPTWSVATVLTIFVLVCFLVERSIHHLSKVRVVAIFFFYLKSVGFQNKSGFKLKNVHFVNFMRRDVAIR